MNFHLPALLCCIPAGVLAVTSADYELAPDTVDAGGGRGVSAVYAADFSQAPGGAGSSALYTSRTGYAGQLDESGGLQIRLDPTPLDETGTGQFRARLLSADGRLTDLPPAEVSWSILGGPLTGITAGGLVTAAATYQSGIATVQATAAGLTGTLSFVVSETIPDNFGLYAGDRLPDAWQVVYLGESGPAGGPAGDPDHDGYNNLLEFAFGTHPGDITSGSDVIQYSGDILTVRGQPVPLINNIPNSVDFRVVFSRRRDHHSAGLLYQVQFSPDLLSWTTGASVPLVFAQDAEFEAVGVTWPFFIDGRKARFFRVMVSLTP